jgi:NAD(P)-dependent dehydrogenase (short-subunit alcohol dehydrogenase family)
VAVEQLEGRVAVVTGAASGIGRAVAEHLAAAGMRLVLADIEEAALAEAAGALAASGTDVVAVPTDVSDGASVEALRDRALDAFGAVHLVHNNAGVGGGGPIWTIPESTWRWLIDVNLWGVIHGIRAFVPLLVEQGEGHVVNTASIAGLMSAPLMGPYNATKHAVVTISETLHNDLRMFGSSVGVSVLCPGFVRTRIAESHRNRPAYVPADDSPEAAVGREVMSQLIAGGIDPGQIAAAVLDAVRTDRFYILTHPELDQHVRNRTERILEGRSPDSPPIV